MINKIYENVDDAVADIHDGATVLFGGFGPSGLPTFLLEALLRQGARDIVGVSNNCGIRETGLAALIKNKQIRKLLSSFPLMKESYIFKEAFLKGEIEIELVPQGTLAERIRAGGAGIEAFYTPAGAGTEIAKGKESKVFGDVECILERAIKGDFSLIRAKVADRWGNLIYRKGSRNFNPIMAMAGRITIVEVDEVVKLGELDPERIVTPGIFVQRVVKRRNAND